MRFCFEIMLLTVYVRGMSAYNILAFFPLLSKSHFNFFTPLIKELTQRGHNITLYSVYPLEGEDLPNLSVVDIHACIPDQFAEYISIDSSNPTILQMVRRYSDSIIKYEKIANCSPIMNLIRSSDRYDAYLTDIVIAEWHAMFAYKFNAPLINIFANLLHPQIAGLIGLPANPSHVPMYTSGSTSRMSFLERIYSFYVYIVMLIVNESYFSVPCNTLSRRLFGENVPSLEQVVKNTSLTLINVHSSYPFAMVSVPNVIAVSGIHIKDSKPLPVVSFVGLLASDRKFLEMDVTCIS